MKKTHCSIKRTAHDENVKKVKSQMVNNDEIVCVAEMFKVFGDLTRCKIVSALFQNPLCVRGIAEVLDMSLSAISHQLKILRQAKLVKFKRNGKEIVYSLEDEHIYKIFEMAKEHIREDE